jgi:hypothetical protein
VWRPKLIPSTVDDQIKTFVLYALLYISSKSIIQWSSGDVFKWHYRDLDPDAEYIVGLYMLGVLIQIHSTLWVFTDYVLRNTHSYKLNIPKYPSNIFVTKSLDFTWNSRRRRKYPAVLQGEADHL